MATLLRFDVIKLIALRSGLGSGAEPIAEGMYEFIISPFDIAIYQPFMVYARNVSVLSSRGIKEIAGVFCTGPYPIEAKVRFSLDLIMHSITITDLEAMSWDEFMARFKERFSLGPQHVSVDDSAKNPKIFDSRDKGLQGRGRCAKCGRSHEGSCCEKRVGCFSCHQIDHFSREFLKGPRLIFFTTTRCAIIRSTIWD